MDKLTKKQHYVPRFYLKYFADSNGRLHVFNRDEDKFYPSNVDNICSNRYLYEVERSRAIDTDASRFIHPNKIENDLSKIESCVSESYKAFIKCCEQGRLEGDDFLFGRFAVGFLFALLLERHPRTVEERRKSAADIARGYINEGRLTEAEAQRLKDRGLKGELVGLTEQFALQASLVSLLENPWIFRIFTRLNDMRLVIEEAPAGVEFVSTSLPIYVAGNSYGCRDFDPDRAYMPLSSRYAAFFVHEKGKTFLHRASIGDVLRYNELLLDSHSVWDVAFAKAKGPLERSVFDWRCPGELQCMWIKEFKSRAQDWRVSARSETLQFGGCAAQLSLGSLFQGLNWWYL